SPSDFVVRAFFLFWRCRDLPERLSFPTRRSSDLIAASLAVALFVAVTVSGLALQSARDEARQERDRLSQVLLDEAANTTEAELEDRKSTRLNSSHVKISYAVFCLKKKKKEHSRGT